MRADLHAHTRCSSDSLLRPEDLPGLARRRRIDCLAITDHNSMAGVLALAGREMPCRVIAGEAAVALAARHGKPMTAGSDGHTRWEVGSCGVEMDDFATPHDFLAALAGANARFFGRASSPLVHLATKAVKVAR